MKLGKVHRSMAFVGVAGLAASICPVATGQGHDDPAAVARELFDAFNRHDMAALTQLYANDADILAPDHPQPLHGSNGVRAIYAPLFATFPDISDHVLSITAQDNRVAVEFVSTGCKRSGKACFTLPIATFLTIRDGRVVRDASYFNLATQ